MSKNNTTYNSGDEAAVKTRQKRDQRADKVAADDLKQVMKTEHGRRFVWGLLEKTGLYQTSFIPNSDQSAFNEGQRNVGLMLWAELHHVCPNETAQMITESKNIGEE